MTWKRNLAVLLSVVAAAACATGEAQWTGTVTDSAGVQIVANTPEGLWAPGDEWALEEELRIGSIDEDPDYQFGQIGWIDVDSRGRMFVFDQQGQHVKVFSADGTYEQTIGGPGSGPGEIGPPTGGIAFLMLGPGDTLFVPDVANQRVNRYAPDGTEAGSIPLDFTNGFPVGWQATGDGMLVEQLRQLNPQAEADDVAPPDVLLKLATDGAISDTLMQFPAGKTIAFSGGAPEWTIYSPEPSWTISGADQLLFGVSDEYRIKFYGPGATLERIVTMPFELRPVGDPDRDAVMAAFEQAFRERGVPATIAQQLRSRVHFAEFLPAFARFTNGPGGSIWVQHIQQASVLTEEELEQFNFLEEIGAPNWDVLDRDGRYLGVVTMPKRYAPRSITDDKIYGVWRDELDVQYVMRLKIIGAEID